MERLEREGKTAMLVAVAWFWWASSRTPTRRRKARKRPRRLGNAGLNVHLLTGDNERTARAVAERSASTPRTSAPKSSPMRRPTWREIQTGGENAMMVGDGVNDAPALAAAIVGTAIGTARHRHRGGGRDPDARRPGATC